MATYPGWEQQVAAAIGAPPTPEVKAFLDHWQSYEGGSAMFNPLNTTQTEPGATAYNTLAGGGHVYNYPSAVTGTTATAGTLLNGNYPAIIAALRSGTPDSWIRSGGKGKLTETDAINELNTWGTHGFAATFGEGSAADAGSFDLGSAASAAKSAGSAIISPITTVEKAIKFVFSYRGLELLGGMVLILIGLIGLMKEVGVSVPAPSVLGKAASVAG